MPSFFLSLLPSYIFDDILFIVKVEKETSAYVMPAKAQSNPVPAKTSSAPSTSSAPKVRGLYCAKQSYGRCIFFSKHLRHDFWPFPFRKRRPTANWGSQSRVLRASRVFLERNRH